jgi:hypothetical protein
MHHYVVAELRLEGNPGRAVRSAQPEFSADTRRAGELLLEGITPVTFERSFCGLETFTGRLFRRGILSDRLCNIGQLPLGNLFAVRPIVVRKK